MEGGIGGGKKERERKGIPKLGGKGNFWVVVQSKKRERREREIGQIESERVHILRLEIGQMEVMKQLLLSNYPLPVFLDMGNTTCRNIQKVMVVVHPLIRKEFLFIFYTGIVLFCFVCLLVLYLMGNIRRSRIQAPVK